MIEQLKELIKEHFLLFEAQFTSTTGLASAIANFLRMKKINFFDMLPTIVSKTLEDTTNDMLKIKNLEMSTQAKREIIDLVIKDLRSTQDYPASIKQKAPMRTMEPEKNKFSLRSIFGL